MTNQSQPLDQRVSADSLVKQWDLYIIEWAANLCGRSTRASYCLKNQKWTSTARAQPLLPLKKTKTDTDICSSPLTRKQNLRRGAHQRKGVLYDTHKNKNKKVVGYFCHCVESSLTEVTRSGNQTKGTHLLLLAGNKNKKTFSGFHRTSVCHL